jgi:acetylglutamate kinase
MTARRVIKLGGNAAAGDALAVLAADLAAMARAGGDVVVVHGGGPQTSELQRKLGQEPRRVAGRRITDGAALDAIKMMVGGKINIDVCAALLAAGASPVGLHGASACVIEALRRPPRPITGAGPAPVDLGLVGDVTSVNLGLLEALMAGGHLPVLACIGASRAGEVFNINADVVATRVAVELGAEALVLVSDTRGVLRDIADPRSRIQRLSQSEAEAAIRAGSVSDGMLAKLEEAFDAVRAGVACVHVVGDLGPGELARELSEPGSIGTALVA